jgi:hypothetical protein
MPAKKQRDGTHTQLAYPANAETRRMIQRVTLAEYEKIVAQLVQSKREPEGQCNDGKALSSVFNFLIGFLASQTCGSIGKALWTISGS